MVDNIILNAIIPLQFAYAHFHSHIKDKEHLLNSMMQMKPELNDVILSYKRLGINIHSAFDTQALLQLKKCYCEKVLCMHCAIGNHILKGA